MAKKSAIVNRRRVLTDPVFEMTRQNNAEFARACKANRLLRHAFRLAMPNKADRYVSGRLTKTMFNILQSDSINDRGERRVTTFCVKFDYRSPNCLTHKTTCNG